MTALDVSYWAVNGVFNKTKKMILHNVTCHYTKGVNIIIGPTGSGKTTFLDLMADRKNPGQSSGQVLLDGKPRASDFKNLVGYVTQDDVMMSTLTVKENIAFSAALRLPKIVCKADKQTRVTEIISRLGLEKCADTKIGDDLIRGVSGGERKRCNIGMEMVISPPVLFLDEPTTGLDASTANSVIKLLKRMSEMGQVIILSIHQPRSSIYQLVDTTTMMAGGRLLYHGPPAQAIDFFASQGFVCEPYHNPPDFFLDVITDDSIGVDKERNVDRLYNGFKTSQWKKSVDKNVQESLDVSRRSPMPTESFVKQAWSSASCGYATGWLHQFSFITLRTLNDVVKNPQITTAMLVKAIILSVFTGSLFWQLDDDTHKALQDRTSVLFFLQLTQQFINLSAVNVFIAERRLFKHEMSNGYYRVSAYFLAKVTCDLIPLRLLPVAIITFSCHYAIGLRPGLEHLMILFLTLYAVCVTSACVCFLVGCSISKDETGQIIMSMIIALSNLYSGFLINFSSMPIALQWMQYFSIAKYAFKILLVNEFADRQFILRGTNHTITGNSHLDQLDISHSSTIEDILPGFIALGIYSIVMLCLAYIRLRFVKMHN